MNHNLCAYCETNIGTASYPQIEHLKPKSKFPEQSFQWSNLHLVCQICNTIKSDKWDAENPILDIVLDNPEEHLQYIFHKMKAKTDRGSTTISHCQLNRSSLLDSRKKIATELMVVIYEANDSDNLAVREFIKSKLDEYVQQDSEYSLMNKTLIKNHLL